MLAGLRAAAPADLDENPWDSFRRVMPVLVPGLEITKMQTFSGGRVGVRARSPMQGSGRFYVVLTHEGVDKGLSDSRRETLLGVDRYRDQADLMVYDNPFSAFLEPQPGVVAAWMAGILLTRTLYDGLPRSAL